VASPVGSMRHVQSPSTKCHNCNTKLSFATPSASTTSKISIHQKMWSPLLETAFSSISSNVEDDEMLWVSVCMTLEILVFRIANFKHSSNACHQSCTPSCQRTKK
jgi:hypothetical protein